MREGIKNNIDWRAHGYEFCGEASDGELAFSMIQKLKPDIVITDIKMPFMDGLVLSRLVKKELPRTEIVILSGYEEFEYAKEGIKLGIARYLLKPVNGDDLLQEIGALAAQIEEKNREREISEKYWREMEKNLLQEKKELFRCLVTGTKSTAELLERAQEMKLDLSAMWYSIVLVKAQSPHHAYDEYSGSVAEAEEKLEKRFAEYRDHLLVFDRDLEGKALLFKADSREELLRIQSSCLAGWKEVLADYSRLRYFGGISMPVNRLGGCLTPLKAQAVRLLTVILWRRVSFWTARRTVGTPRPGHRSLISATSARSRLTGKRSGSS